MGEGLALVAVASLSEHSGEGGVGVVAEDEDDVLVVDEVDGVDAEGFAALGGLAAGDVLDVVARGAGVHADAFVDLLLVVLEVALVGWARLVEEDDALGG